MVKRESKDEEDGTIKGKWDSTVIYRRLNVELEELPAFFYCSYIDRGYKTPKSGSIHLGRDIACGLGFRLAAFGLVWRVGGFWM